MLTPILCPFHPRVTAVAHKRLQSFCQSAGGRLHLNMHTPLTQSSQCGLTMRLSRHSVGMLENELKCSWSGNSRPQLSQLTEPLWTDPGLKSGISVHELIFTFKKKMQVGNEWSNILPKFSQARKKSPPPPPLSYRKVTSVRVCA